MEGQFTQFENCWLCGSSQIKNLYTVNRFTIARYEFTLARCKSCSLTFCRDRVDDEYLKNFYAQMPTQTGNRIYSEKSNERNLNYAHAAVADKIKKYFDFKNHLNILDLGCSNGSFLDQFPEWNVYGVELEETTGKSRRTNIKTFLSAT